MAERAKTRCPECGGTHKPHCKPASLRTEANIWKGILRQWQEEKTDRSKTHPDTLFLTDNGACYCGSHLGASARFTGCDISGQAILQVTPEIAKQSVDGFGMVLKCEQCGKVASLLVLA